MNSKLVMLVLATFFVSPVVMAKSVDKSSARFHYKCYLTLEDERDVVHGFVSSEDNIQIFQEQLLGEIVFSADGVTGTNIASVYECVTSKQLFTSKEGRTLEANTPK